MLGQTNTIYYGSTHVAKTRKPELVSHESLPSRGKLVRSERAARAWADADTAEQINSQMARGADRAVKAH